jgi:PhzF family phenazine biosynthesis protein
MRLTLFQIDAFADKPFTGNPAGVCPLETWLPADIMQAIAMENNLSETAFFVPNKGGYDLRWFTPAIEVKLCGHATLAGAYVLFELLGYADNVINFYTKSGKLTVTRQGDLLTMNFPAQPAVSCDPPPQMVQAFGREPAACLESEDYLAVFADEEDILALDPDMSLLKKLGLRGVIVTAPAGDYDFVSRFFAPKAGIDEDPVTGSSFTQLVPYWAARLGKTKFRARQVSARGGNVWCELLGDRVAISGRAVKYLEGQIEI